MKPIAIFRHSPGEGPGYFATFLDRHSLPWQLFKIDEGDAPPASADGFSGLCFMGGPMSVNDDLPWIPALLELIRDADRKQIPVIGHCLGGQLLSKALGGTVTANPVKEIGWGQVKVAAPEVLRWIGLIPGFETFHWHGETFSLPEGAIRILKTEWCENQAFEYGPHLAMQFHVEVTEPMVRLWCEQWANDVSTASASVQTAEQMQENLATRIAKMQVVADRIYSRWAKGLQRD